MSTAAAAAVGACAVDDIGVEGLQCPCAPGYVCDTPHNVCVKPEVLLDGAVIVGDAPVNPSPPPPPAPPPPCSGPDCPCTVETDCADPRYPKCNGTQCVECLPAADNCGVGTYCLPTHVCAPGCKASSECAVLSPSAPFCNTSLHQCVECANDGSCTGGKKCSPGGVCVDACTADGGTCPGNAKCCGGLCIDTSSDPGNCNGCGLACTGATSLCCNSTCTDPLTSTGNCGKCGFACNSTVNDTGSSCSAGNCQFTCKSGFGHCQTGNTGCETSTVNNTTACGSCATNCNVVVVNATGISCVASTCGYSACKSGFYEADGKTSDGCEACGAKGQWCCPGNLCPVSGQCEPLPGNDGHCH